MSATDLAHDDNDDIQKIVVALKGRGESDASFFVNIHVVKV